MPTIFEAQKRHSVFYGFLVQLNSKNFSLLDQEFPQIQIAISWLVKQTDTEQAQSFLGYVRELAPYLQKRGLNSDLLSYAEKASQVAAQTGANPGWLYLLEYEAYWALGEWENALVAAQNAIRTTENDDIATYARSVLALGRLQLNRGQYGDALRTLAKAHELLTKVHDYDGVAAAKAEVAAYHLNRNEHQKALRLYQEVDKLRRQVDSNTPSHHTLLMLGVIHRRLRQYPKAIESLTELVQDAEVQKDRGAVATGKHHLAWIFYDRHEWKKARQFGQEAKELYEQIRDPRGSSDADEQLGLICLAERDFDAANMFLNRSLTVREQLGNQHGVASSLRRLAKLYLAQARMRLGLKYLWQSLSLYHRLGVLSYQRFINIIRDLLE